MLPTQRAKWKQSAIRGSVGRGGRFACLPPRYPSAQTLCLWTSIRYLVRPSLASVPRLACPLSPPSQFVATNFCLADEMCTAKLTRGRGAGRNARKYAQTLTLQSYPISFMFFFGFSLYVWRWCDSTFRLITEKLPGVNQVHLKLHLGFSPRRIIALYVDTLKRRTRRRPRRMAPQGFNSNFTLITQRL